MAEGLVKGNRRIYEHTRQIQESEKLLSSISSGSDQNIVHVCLIIKCIPEKRVLQLILSFYKFSQDIKQKNKNNILL